MRAAVTLLEMRAPFPERSLAEPAPLPSGLTFSHDPTPELSEYRAVYDLIGSDWYWVNRKAMRDAQLGPLISSDKTEIYYLKSGDRIIGFLELNFRNFPEVEIVFIGLEKTYIGQGLGLFLIRSALKIVQSRNAASIRIQTCTLDHPRAILLYQSHGFTAVSRQNVILKNDRFHIEP